MSSSKDETSKKPQSRETKENWREKCAEMEKELEKAKKEAEEYLNGWKREKADFENYKKSQEKYNDEFRKYANENIIKKLLPIIDSLELATLHLPEDLKNSQWAKGILCIKNQFDDFLKETGVEKIKALGEKFDPDFFEATEKEESDQEEGTIVAEIQKGYKMFGKVIRTAKVKVAKKRE